MGKMIIGRFIPVDSILHRMDPRSKLLLVFLFICVVFLANNIWSYSLLIIYVATLVAISNVPIKYIYSGLRPIFWLIIFTFILHIFFTKNGELLFEWGWIKIYEEGIRMGILISIRFFLLIIMTSLLTLTTTPIELTDAIETLLGPLKKVKFPVYELALMMSISLRFIPTLMDETEKIMKAQMARGVEFSSGSIKSRVQAIIPLLIPLFVNSFKRAEELAIAMEARGYQGGEGRTKYRQLVWSSIDTIMIIILILVTAMLFVLRT
ncbi:energy-coupling factor transporter transmembrane component T [Niallia alba]|uniref:energy-coupling factor transporter transmembrane component T family protein n=1 Tax=Niallia alba TaxID=2729105 RepID=UPI0003328920|nr:energy-coupling factor transporter transmembrane component T [Niallia alba]EOR22046.1 cobalt ABC transporter permease CbiQ [Niallia nealsonii AAU1]MED3792647.1 energy-coupling factor transporter transmembrane component T [Niallia alba]